MNKGTKALYLTGALALAAAIAAWAERHARDEPGDFVARAVAAYPHDPRAFTQGLTIEDGQLYESTGQYGRSSLRRVDLVTGEVEQKFELNRNYFAEGIAVLGNRVFQLTWRSGIGIVYDRDTFTILDTFRYDGEGWGLTDDGEHLILSDGTARIRFLDPETFDVVRSIEVRGEAGPVTRINELEFIDGKIWANVWYEDFVLRIDPSSGSVLGTVDLAGLYQRAERGSEDVANGIAWDPVANRIFVTGKNWPRLFEITLEPVP